MMQRLDKILADANVGTRKEVKALVARGRVAVDGTVVRTSDTKVDAESATITVDGNPIVRRRRVVCMMNKPAGYVTSTDDPLSPTVMELLPQEMLDQAVVPVGRLDKDTEGLLLFTNDGELLHLLISPNSNVEKKYYARHEGVATEADVQALADGVTLRDGTKCRSARLQVLGEGECVVTVTEGQYHLVRRMMASRGLRVVYLRRVAEAGLELGGLGLGETVEVEL